MQYKSARPCFSIFSKKNLLGAIACAFAAKTVLAAITIAPLSKVNFSTLYNTANSAYYYPIFYTPGTANGLSSPPTGIAQVGVLDPNFSFIDLGQDPDPAGDMQTETGTILFNVTSTATSTTQVILAATMLDSGTNLQQFVPIIGWGTNNVMTGCAGSSGCLQTGATSRAPGNKNLYYGVYYNPGQTFQIAISPTAFCESFDITTQSNTSCSQSFFTNGGGGGSSQQMVFNFIVIPASSVPINLSYTTAVPTSTNDSQAVTLDFVSLNPNPIPSVGASPSPTPSPTLNCNLEEGVIAPQPGGFTLQAPQNFTIENDPTNTIGQLIAVGIPSPGPLNATVGGYPSNPVVDYSQQVPAVGVFFGSFLPSTPSSPIDYDLGFLAEDPAGFIIDDGGGSGQCTFPGVFSTSVVNGFLQQSKCFIATAAFRDLNSAPLVLLRSFRDHFLENFSLGRSFVHWYYGWSPNAAEWLIDHPVFRFPVLLALIPLQAFAWLVLHPYAMVVLLLMGISTILWGTRLKETN
jgi:hypothetical protein